MAPDTSSDQHAESVCPAGPDGVHYFFSDDECAYCHKLDQIAEYVAERVTVSKDDLLAFIRASDDRGPYSAPVWRIRNRLLDAARIDGDVRS